MNFDSFILYIKKLSKTIYFEDPVRTLLLQDHIWIFIKAISVKDYHEPTKIYIGFTSLYFSDTE